MWFPSSEGKTAAGTLSRGESVVLQVKNWWLTDVDDSCHDCIWCDFRKSFGV